MRSLSDDIVKSITTLHYYNDSNGDFIGSSGCLIVYQIDRNCGSFSLPATWFDILSFSRLLSRLLRLDKVNIINISSSSLVILRQNTLFRYSFSSRRCKRVLHLPTTRNILMGASCTSEDGSTLYFGDYGSTKMQKNIYKSVNDGRSWEVCYTYKSGEIKQVLNISWDRYSAQFYVTTGDEVGQCYISVFDKHMQYLDTIGDGSLTYRAISINFFEEEIRWITNDPYNGSSVFGLDRTSQKLTRKSTISGSVWYSKVLDDGRFLLSTCAENLHTDNVPKDLVEVYISEDYCVWELFCSFEKDFYPKTLFRFGLVSFPNGSYSLDNTFINTEAVISYDGRVSRLREFEFND